MKPWVSRVAFLLALTAPLALPSFAAEQALGLKQKMVTLMPSAHMKVSGQAQMTILPHGGMRVRVALTGVGQGARVLDALSFGTYGAGPSIPGFRLAKPVWENGQWVSETTVPKVAFIPETGWCFKVFEEVGGREKMIAMADLGPIAKGTAEQQKETATSIVSLQIGPLSSMITAAQAKHGLTGDVMVQTGNMMPAMAMTDHGQKVNMHLELHVFSRQTGAVELGLMPKIELISEKTGVKTIVQSVPMYSSKTGIPDYHYGNAVAVKPGRYTVNVQIGKEKIVFRGVLITKAMISGKASPGGMTGMGNMSGMSGM
ncbi:hypothetical protein [Ferroacidibacillus organovorans]|uniref:YtkA-like domain-containing protein n=1 Tax=Ferroacidibacillus organovorans TaxID=1765683 RepID=A0A101XNP0_9BACL|nr:hypothetical protein [Ferroacidibacillus organovorans]KUO94772.1 hypothetical protein ATW55_10150 [Ferroacidibacillus organovorans]